MGFFDKSGQGHVEKILSMVLFAGFIMLLFFFMRPVFQEKKEGDFYLKDIQDNITGLMDSDIGKLSVIVAKLNENGEKNCYFLSDEIKNAYGDYFIEVQDLKNPRKYTIYFGAEFPKNTIPSCENRLGIEFTLGVYVKEKMLTEPRIKILKKSYEDKYNALISTLKVEDFVFDFKDDANVIDPELSVEKNIPENVEIISLTRIVRVIDENGRIRELKLNIRTWR